MRNQLLALKDVGATMALLNRGYCNLPGKPSRTITLTLTDEHGSFDFRPVESLMVVEV